MRGCRAVNVYSLLSAYAHWLMALTMWIAAVRLTYLFAAQSTLVLV